MLGYENNAYPCTILNYHGNVDVLISIQLGSEQL